MKKIIAFGLALSPAIAFAQAGTQLGGVGTANQLLIFIQDGFNILSGLILGAAVIFFLWGVFQYVRAAGDEDAQKIGRMHIINGIIGIAVMVSVWGLVNFFTKSAGLSNNPLPPPAIPQAI